MLINNDFIEKNKNFVYSIVNKYCNNETKEDLFQVGMYGMLMASKKYDVSKNVKFSTFAYKYVLGEILKYLRENRNIKPSRDIIKIYVKIKETKELIFMTEGKYPTNKELANILHVDENRINEIENICSCEKSLDIYLTDEDNITLEDMISQEEMIDKNEIIQLKDALRTLTKSEQEFIYKRYYQNFTQTEIANEKNINQVKVYRYERSLLDKLKKELV